MRGGQSQDAHYFYVLLKKECGVQFGANSIALIGDSFSTN